MGVTTNTYRVNWPPTATLIACKCGWLTLTHNAAPTTVIATLRCPNCT